MTALLTGRSILVVDDHAPTCASLEQHLQRAGAATLGVLTGAQALEHLTQRAYSIRPFDAVVLDLWLEHEDGLDILRAAKAIAPATKYVMMSGESNLRAAVEAIRMGASDFVVKPFAPGELVEALRRALAHTSDSVVEAGESSEFRFRARYAPDYLGDHAKVRALFVIIERIARSPSTVLLRGETGTGKELVARALHGASARSNGPFVVINCGSLHDAYAESMLFGHVRGAFPGASEAQDGFVSAANRGTLFLDGVADMPLAVQSRLLRVLEQREVVPLGAAQPRRVDIRVIASTHRDLALLVERGVFREDLYHRLNALPVELPALRERAQDIPLLFSAMRRRHASQAGAVAPDLTAAAWARVISHPWPGNVRALDHFVERLCVMQSELIVEESVLDGLGLERSTPLVDDASHSRRLDLQHALPRSGLPRASDFQEDEWSSAGRRAHLTLLPSSVPDARSRRDSALNHAERASSRPETPHLTDSVTNSELSRQIAGTYESGRCSAQDSAATALPPHSVSGAAALVREAYSGVPGDLILASTSQRLQLPKAGIALYELLESIENDLIRQALARTGGNRSAAAQLLGIRRTTLVEKLRRARGAHGDERS